MTADHPDLPDLGSDGTLFTLPAYLEPLERSGCASPRTGWTRIPVPQSRGDVPCYLKTHSWGEFVFDFQFARAYAQHGLDYYPKLVCCVPFTPVPGPRLLASDDDGRRAIAAELIETAGILGASGVHVLYPQPREVELLEAQSWLRREQLRYLWHNRGYADFDAFLAALAPKRRKNIRRERRLIAEAGFEIEWRVAAALSPADWSAVFGLYASTYEIRGQAPYLDRSCLQDWAGNFGEAMQLCIARRDGRLLAMAFFFRDRDHLYGRHWGSAADVPLLHFELCYYQGIEYAIGHGLRTFDAGVQGEHKLLRGFDPVRTYSMHWFAHAGMRGAVSRYYEQERAALDEQLRALSEHSAYGD